MTTARFADTKSCEPVIKAINDTANCTNCSNWSPARRSKLPDIRFRVGRTADNYLVYNMTDLLISMDNACVLLLPLIYKDKAVAGDMMEGVTLGYDYFFEYESVQYDFDGYKVAFNGGHEFRPIPPTPKP